MLTKLLKYEFSGLFKTNLLLWGAMAALAISMLVGSAFQIAYINNTLFTFSIIASVAILGFYPLLSVVRFYKQMCMDEGHFTYTVPTSIFQILVSKVLPFLAYMAGLTALVFGFWVMVYNLNIADFITTLFVSIKEGLTQYPGIFTTIAISVVFSTLFTVGLAVFSCALGNIPFFKDRNISLVMTDRKSVV